MPQPSGAPFVAETLQAQKKRIADLEGSLQEMIDVMAPTIRSEMNLTQAQGSARIRAIALLKQK